MDIYLCTWFAEELSSYVELAVFEVQCLCKNKTNLVVLGQAQTDSLRVDVWSSGGLPLTNKIGKLSLCIIQ